MSVAQPAVTAVVRDAAPLRGYLFGLVGVAIWAGWAVLTRMDMRGHMAVTDLVALRFATAGLVLLPVLVKKGLPFRQLGVFGILGLAGGAGAPYVLLGAGGHAYAPVSHSGVLICCGVPLATAVLARFTLGERFTARRLVGYGLILTAAVVLLVESGLAAPTGDNVLIGDAMFVVSALFWATYTVLARRFGLDPLHTTAIVAVVSATLYLPIYLLVLTPHVDTLSWGQIATQAGFQGIVTSIVSLLCFSTAISYLGASRTAALSALVPATSVLLAMPVLGEWPGLWESAGLVLGTIGVALASGAIGGGAKR
ncbi:DMT family transporter [Zavarzinia sp.]|uniref:DMT family transporter n=1 Tax=Zavarzinia sp. TaxID=2027920 RepID=UPI0035685E12